MATKLDKELKREVDVNGQTYVVTISPEGLKMTMKRGRTALVDKTWPQVLDVPAPK